MRVAARRVCGRNGNAVVFVERDCDNGYRLGALGAWRPTYGGLRFADPPYPRCTAAGDPQPGRCAEHVSATPIRPMVGSGARKP